MLNSRRIQQRMNNEIQKLGQQLVEHKLINPGVTISARVPTKGFGHAIMTVEREGTVVGADKDGIMTIFENRRQQHIKFEDLVAIEGMDLPRFAQAYRIKTTSKKKKR